MSSVRTDYVSRIGISLYFPSDGLIPFGSLSVQLGSDGFGGFPRRSTKTHRDEKKDENKQQGKRPNKKEKQDEKGKIV